MSSTNDDDSYTATSFWIRNYECITSVEAPDRKQKRGNRHYKRFASFRWSFRPCSSITNERGVVDDDEDEDDKRLKVKAALASWARSVPGLELRRAEGGYIYTSRAIGSST
jgi:hypothetical protein